MFSCRGGGNESIRRRQQIAISLTSGGKCREYLYRVRGISPFSALWFLATFRYHFQAPIAQVYKRNTTRVEAQRCSWSHTLSSSSAQSETGFRFDLSLYRRRLSERRLQNSYSSSSSFHHAVKVRREYDEERLFSSPLRSLRRCHKRTRTLSTRRHSLSQTNPHKALSITQVSFTIPQTPNKIVDRLCGLMGAHSDDAPLALQPPFFRG